MNFECYITIHRTAENIDIIVVDIGDGLGQCAGRIVVLFAEQLIQVIIRIFPVINQIAACPPLGQGDIPGQIVGVLIGAAVDGFRPTPEGFLLRGLGCLMGV